jgi:hypothetical protein
MAFAARLGAAAREPANWVQLAKFALIGGSGYVINLGVFTLLGDSLGVAHQIAAVAAFAVAVVTTPSGTATGRFAPAMLRPGSRRPASSPSALPRWG